MPAFRPSERPDVNETDGDEEFEVDTAGRGREGGIKPIAAAPNLRRAVGAALRKTIGDEVVAGAGKDGPALALCGKPTCSPISRSKLSTSGTG